jgi:hypothetical protein
MAHNLCDQQRGHRIATPICMILFFSEEESGLGSWPEPNDRETTVKEVNGVLSLFHGLRYYWLISFLLFVALKLSRKI